MDSHFPLDFPFEHNIGFAVPNQISGFPFIDSCFPSGYLRRLPTTHILLQTSSLVHILSVMDWYDLDSWSNNWKQMNGLIDI